MDSVTNVGTTSIGADICNMATILERADELVRNRIYNHADLAALGFNRQSVHRLVTAQVLVSPVNGLFHHKERDSHELDDLAFIAKRYPDAVFNLYTAAKHWDITQLESDYIWVEVPASRKKKITMGDNFYTPIRTLLTDRNADLTVGVVDVDINGQTIRMTNAERTVIDMWRMSGNRHPKGIVVREENLFQTLGAYLEQTDGKSGRLADMFGQLGLGDRAQARFFDFAKTYANGFEAQRTF